MYSWWNFLSKLQRVFIGNRLRDPRLKEKLGKFRINLVHRFDNKTDKTGICESVSFVGRIFRKIHSTLRENTELKMLTFGQWYTLCSKEKFIWRRENAGVMVNWTHIPRWGLKIFCLYWARRNHSCVKEIKRLCIWVNRLLDFYVQHLVAFLRKLIR